MHALPVLGSVSINPAFQWWAIPDLLASPFLNNNKTCILKPEPPQGWACDPSLANQSVPSTLAAVNCPVSPPSNKRGSVYSLGQSHAQSFLATEILSKPKPEGIRG